MSFNRTSELTVSRSKSSFLNSIRFVNMTWLNDLNFKLRDLRDENSSILISGVRYIPVSSLKDIKTIS